MFSSICALPSPTSAEGCPSLFGWFTGVGSEEARNLPMALASVRRSNCTDGFPVYSFHDDALPRGAIEGIRSIKFTKRYSPYSLVSGSCRQPPFRQRLNRCDRIRRTIQASSR